MIYKIHHLEHKICLYKGLQELSLVFYHQSLLSGMQNVDHKVDSLFWRLLPSI